MQGTFSHALAEFAIFGCLYFAKLMPRMLKQKRAHKWEKFNVQELRYSMDAYKLARAAAITCMLALYCRIIT